MDAASPMTKTIGRSTDAERCGGHWLMEDVEKLSVMVTACPADWRESLKTIDWKSLGV